MFFYQLPTFVLISFILPNPRTLQLMFLVFTQIHDLQHGLKGNSANTYSTQFVCILILYIPLSLQLKLCHQSSTSTPYRNKFYQEYIACHSVSIDVVEIKYNDYKPWQVKSTISWNWSWKKKNLLHCFWIPLLILPSIIQISKPPFNVAPSLAIHSSVPINFT